MMLRVSSWLQLILTRDFKKKTFEIF
jgi:hypothetical protein